MAQPRVVIVGAGFAGLEAARLLRGRPLQVSVVDPAATFSWMPNLHEVLSDRKTPAMLSLPRHDLVRRWGHTAVPERALHIDPRAQEVHLGSGRRLAYDIAIVATGGRSAIAEVPALAIHSHSLRSVDDAHRIRERLRTLESSGRDHHVVVAGGGFVGVEVVGELLRARVARRRITLVDGGPRLMAGTPRSLHRALSRQLARAGVDVRLGDGITAIEPERVVLRSSGALPADLTIEALGLGPSPLLAASGLSTTSGWGAVGPTLQSPMHDNVFVVGDGAAVGSLAKQAYHALMMGASAARNTERVVQGRPAQPFRAMQEAFLLTLGSAATYLIAGPLALQNRSLAAAREAIFQVGMLKLDPASGAEGRGRFRTRARLSVLQRVWPQTTG